MRMYMYVVICKIDHCIHIHWCIPMGLGHNDPWVESHMWPQQTLGQRSFRGQWPLVQVFGKRVSVSTYFNVFSNLILQWLHKYVIAKAGETRGLRTTLFLVKKGCNLKTKQLSKKLKYFFRYYHAYAACNVWIWWVVPFFSKAGNYQKKKKKKKDFP